MTTRARWQKRTLHMPTSSERNEIILLSIRNGTYGVLTSNALSELLEWGRRCDWMVYVRHCFRCSWSSHISTFSHIYQHIDRLNGGTARKIYIFPYYGNKREKIWILFYVMWFCVYLFLCDEVNDATKSTQREWAENTLPHRSRRMGSRLPSKFE